MTHQTPQKPNEVNVFERKDAEEIITEEIKALSSSDIYPELITDRHIRGSSLQSGNAADLPDGTTHTKMFYENDTKKLQIWNSTNESWDEVQFS